VTNPRFPNVFKPLQLGSVTLRNRMFVPAHTTNFGVDNLPSQRHVDYHRARAKGGAAMIIFEGIRVHKSTLGRSQGVNGYDPACIPKFAQVADAVRAEGAHLLGQVIHLGRHVDGNFARTSAWGASAIPWTATAPPPHPMTIADIQEVVQAHADVATNLVKAGLTGIEVQMAHGHLLQQFMSPASNKRNDAYGGSEANRLRFAKEALRAVREAVGPEVVVGIRVSGDEYLPEGLTIDDMCRIVPDLVAATKVDFVNISHSAYHGSYTVSTQMADMSFPVDSFRSLTQRLRTVLRDVAPPLVVMTVCQYRDIADAETVLADGMTDMVGMARAHIADPEIVGKAERGDEDQTTRCIACNQGCAGMLALNLPVTCLVNPMAGREGEAPRPSTGVARKVLVIGGGPAGMKAASVAAANGHTVTLWEQSSRLGGRLNATRVMPLRQEFEKLLSDLERQCAAPNVEVVLEKTATNAEVDAFGADDVILATGASQPGAAFPGGGLGLSLDQVVADPAALGNKIVLVDTLGTWTTASVAEYLADLGKDVVLMVPTGTPAWTISMYSAFALSRRLKEKGVKMLGHRTPDSFLDGCVVARDLSTGDTEDIGMFDAVIAPTPGQPNDELVRELGGNAAQLHVIGDAMSPRTALEAIFEGHEVARAL
jgi:2,4-dienoyl-CoA reductase-like NADH-dependent reductase (Old Yellow Enzyme family)/thioredoxin reductase